MAAGLSALERGVIAIGGEHERVAAHGAVGNKHYHPNRTSLTPARQASRPVLVERDRRQVIAGRDYGIAVSAERGISSRPAKVDVSGVVRWCSIILRRCPRHHQQATEQYTPRKSGFFHANLFVQTNLQS